jgi:RES domain-containing protein
MITVHRIGHKSFISDLEGIGAKKFGGRWNPQGIPCLYCSEHLSLAVLEKFAHAQGKSEMINLATISIKIPAACKLYKLEVGKLEKNWMHNIAYSQWLGKQILQDLTYTGFVAPSVIIPGEMNIILNPLATGFKKVLAAAPTDFELDGRLFIQLPG